MPVGQINKIRLLFRPRHTHTHLMQIEIRFVSHLVNVMALMVETYATNDRCTISVLMRMISKQITSQNAALNLFLKSRPYNLIFDVLQVKNENQFRA